MAPTNTAKPSRSDHSGPAWEIAAFYRFDGGALHVGAMTAMVGTSRVPAPLAVAIPQGARQLEVWFKNTDRAGCVSWDSRFGENYRFRFPEYSN